MAQSGNDAGQKKKIQARDHSAPSLLITRTAPAQIKKLRAKRFPSSNTNTDTRTNKAIAFTLDPRPSFLPSCKILSTSLSLSSPLTSHTEAPVPGHLVHLDSFLELQSTTTLISDHQLALPSAIHCGINHLRRLLSAPLSSRGLTTLDEVSFSSLPLASSCKPPGYLVIGPRRLFLCSVFVSFESFAPSNELPAPPRHTSPSGPVLDTSSRYKTHLQDLVDDVGIYSTKNSQLNRGTPSGRLPRPTLVFPLPFHVFDWLQCFFASAHKQPRWTQRRTARNCTTPHREPPPRPNHDSSSAFQTRNRGLSTPDHRTLPS
ncbi:hypothetical protein CSAL01_07052 [Colletotrichum salicis]|uniref:Uncharacterized protein n=1 Tax=Colletotrichum salicis TaxID=1209931 RepID=A0A135UI59_9PEZI|nr:hypothetical protein CSAL01_07052 [Colletotrichum salicis]